MQHVSSVSVLNEPSSAMSRSVRQITQDLGYPTDWTWAWNNYKKTILELSQEKGLKRHLEVGGGRNPLFSPSEITTYGLDMTLNDISAKELSLAPSDYNKIQCDIAAPASVQLLGTGRYDLVYCQMVMEHVKDVAAMWRNIHDVLAPGGIALSFFPTLYAPPYVLNRLLPESFSRWLLEKVFPDRKPDTKNPKFPAFYDHCFGDEGKILPMLNAAGFSDVVVLPFWGYSYFWKFPGIKQLDGAFTRLAQKRNWRSVTSFAYVIATK